MTIWPWKNGERYGSTHQHWKQRCTTCAHFQRGPEGDRVQQCTNPDAPLYRASEWMHLATACRLYEVRGQAR